MFVFEDLLLIDVIQLKEIVGASRPQGPDRCAERNQRTAAGHFLATMSARGRDDEGRYGSDGAGPDQGSRSGAAADHRDWCGNWKPRV